MTTRTTLDTHIIKNNGAVCYLAKSRVATSGSGDDSVELKSSSSSGVDKHPRPWIRLSLFRRYSIIDQYCAVVPLVHRVLCDTTSTHRITTFRTAITLEPNLASNRISGTVSNKSRGA